MLFMAIGSLAGTNRLASGEVPAFSRCQEELSSGFTEEELSREKRCLFCLPGRMIPGQNSLSLRLHYTKEEPSFKRDMVKVELRELGAISGNSQMLCQGLEKNFTREMMDENGQTSVYTDLKTPYSQSLSVSCDTKGNYCETTSFNNHEYNLKSYALVLILHSGENTGTIKTITLFRTSTNEAFVTFEYVSEALLIVITAAVAIYVIAVHQGKVWKEIIPATRQLLFLVCLGIAGSRPLGEGFGLFPEQIAPWTSLVSECFGLLFKVALGWFWTESVFGISRSGAEDSESFMFFLKPASKTLLSLAIILKEGTSLLVRRGLATHTLVTLAPYVPVAWWALAGPHLVILTTLIFLICGEK